MFTLVRAWWRALDAELATGAVLRVWSCLMAWRLVRWLVRRVLAGHSTRLNQRLWGLDFASPVALAAGLDRDGRHAASLAVLGFGSVEVGSVTGAAHHGSARPRMFHLWRERAIWERSGLANAGSRAVAVALRRRRPGCPVGVNLAPTPACPREQWPWDLQKSLERLYPVADFFVLNAAALGDRGGPQSPRDGGRELGALVTHLRALSEQLGREHGLKARPILVKLPARDVGGALWQAMLASSLASGVEGLIVSGGHSRERLAASVQGYGSGQLRGAPVLEDTLRAIRLAADASGGRVPVVASGGIFSSEDVVQALKAGACLVQLYSALVFEGPLVVGRLNRALVRYCRQHRLRSLAELIGVGRAVRGHELPPPDAGYGPPSGGVVA